MGMLTNHHARGLDLRRLVRKYTIVTALKNRSLSYLHLRAQRGGTGTARCGMDIRARASRHASLSRRCLPSRYHMQ